MLCRIDLAALLRDDLIEAVWQPNLGKRGSQKVAQVDPETVIDWQQTPGELKFNHIPHYFLVLRDGRVPKQYIKIIGFNQPDVTCPVCGTRDKYWVKSVDVFHCPNDHQWFNYLGSDPHLPHERELLTFPKEELDDLEWRLGEFGFCYTTRIQKERGKYKQGHVYRSDIGGCRLYVEEVVDHPHGKVAEHPFVKELTEEQRQLINGHPYEVLKLLAIDSCNYDITGVPFPVQTHWFEHGDKAAVLAKHFGPQAVKGCDTMDTTGTPAVAAGLEGGAGEAQRQKIVEKVYKVLKTLMPNGDDAEQWKTRITAMSLTQFNAYMTRMLEGKDDITINAPPFGNVLRMENVLAAAKLTKTKLFHRVWFESPATGRRVLSNEYLPIVELHCRRVQQFIDKKLAIPDDDTHIDAMTGQVTSNSRALGLSHPEIQVLQAIGLDDTLSELVRVRGGDMHAYEAFIEQLENQGEADINLIDGSTRARVSSTVGSLMRGMGLRHNL
jgi:hypothetical protein